MRRQDLLLLAFGAVTVALIYSKRQTVADQAGNIIAAGEALMSGWQNVEQGPKWVPVINQTEQSLGIPANLLARMAYQESHFIPSIIDGTRASPAGALGILQLEPTYFKSVNVARPYTDADTVNQISEAGEYLVKLYDEFGDWATALAAYNDGPGNVNAYLQGSKSLPQETIDYVTKILADVPVASASDILNA